MRYSDVAIAAFAHELPPHVVTSDEIEERLAPVYDALHLPAGRLELMTGIRERRFFDPGTRPSDVSIRTASAAVSKSGIERERFGALLHGSVCRDQMEPATANRVHHETGLPSDCLVLDVSNACLGVLNGMHLLAELIERGQIEAGVVVGTETGRGLVEGTIDSLLADDTLTRKSIKGAFASLTIGSGSAAVVLCKRALAPSGSLLLSGGVCRTDTSAHRLCAGGTESEFGGDHRPRMVTDSEALLHAGITLAGETYPQFLKELGWETTDLSRVITHQVGKQHRKALLDRLGLPDALDFPTVETLGNIGSVALPMAASLAIEQDEVGAGDRIAFLGIGSGLSAFMLGAEFPT